MRDFLGTYFQIFPTYSHTVPGYSLVYVTHWTVFYISMHLVNISQLLLDFETAGFIAFLGQFRFWDILDQTTVSFTESQTRTFSVHTQLTVLHKSLHLDKKNSKKVYLKCVLGIMEHTRNKVWFTWDNKCPIKTPLENFMYFFLIGGPDSSVGIATGYGLDGPGIESRWGARFSAPVHTGPGTHPASCTMGHGSFPGVKSGRDVSLTPHSLLLP